MKEQRTVVIEEGDFSYHVNVGLYSAIPHTQIVLLVSGMLADQGEAMAQALLQSVQRCEQVAVERVRANKT